MRFYRDALNWEPEDAVGRRGTVWAATPKDAEKIADTVHHVMRPPPLLNPRRRRGWSMYEVSVERGDVFDLTTLKEPGVGLLHWAFSHTPPTFEWARFMESGIESPCLIRVAAHPASAVRCR